MLESLIKKIDAGQSLGVKTAEDGSRIIAHTPQEYPQAYLHAFYSARTKSEWKKYQMELPAHLRELYEECNGLTLLGTSLSIYGMRSHFKRDDTAAFQPFDLSGHDRECRLANHPLTDIADHRVFFGGYSWDGSSVYVMQRTSEFTGVATGRQNQSLNGPASRSF